jgi:hypothetical protein
MRERFCGFLIASSLAACGGSPPPDIARDGGAPIHTDQPRYAAGRAPGGVDFTIPFTYRNRSADPVFVVHCSYGARVGNRTVTRVDLSMSLQKKSGERWQPAWEGITTLCLSDPVWIAPGATYTDTMRIFGGKPGGSYAPRLEVERVAGEYRLVWHQLRTARPGAAYPEGDTLPLDARVSNAFVLTGGW